MQKTGGTGLHEIQLFSIPASNRMSKTKYGKAIANAEYFSFVNDSE